MAMARLSYKLAIIWKVYGNESGMICNNLEIFAFRFI